MYASCWVSVKVLVVVDIIIINKHWICRNVLPFFCSCIYQVCNHRGQCNHYLWHIYIWCIFLWLHIYTTDEKSLYINFTRSNLLNHVLKLYTRALKLIGLNSLNFESLSIACNVTVSFSRPLTSILTQKQAAPSWIWCWIFSSETYPHALKWS